MSTRRSGKFPTIILGILLLPCCVAITFTFFHQLGVVGRGAGLLRDWKFLCLALGFVLWLVLYLVLPPPRRVYVFGHELTHALVAWMTGAKVRRFRAGAKGGHVALDRTNFLIALAPYFLPIYAVIVIVLFRLGDVIFDWSRYLGGFYIALGLAYGFHVTLTISTLLTTQSDVTRNGWLFSMALIYWMNFLVLGLLFAAITTRGNVALFFKLLWRDQVDVWTWLARAVG